MAVNCPGCGKENSDGARFCTNCGAAIIPPSAATVMQPPPAFDPSTAPTTALPTVTPDAAPAHTPPPPPYTPPAPAYVPPAPAYAPPAQPYGQPIQPQPYAPVYRQPAYPATAAAGAASRRSGASIAGALIVLICGILILASSFMAWYGVGGFFSVSGWDLMKDMQDGGKNPFVNSADLGTGGSKLIFSGLCSLIIGAVIIPFGLLTLFVRSKGLGVLPLLLSIGALMVAGINAYSFLTIEGFSLEAGMYVLLLGSVGSTIGSIVCTAG